MTTYYVGIGGNNGSAGTSWAARKATLNGAEDIPVAAGDVVYVGPGTYRELLTVDVSGSGGSPITYIGDYTGANTDGTGGIVRITGSDNDQSATRASCITATTKVYRTFRGFLLDGGTGNAINLPTSCTNIIIDQCAILAATSQSCVAATGASQAAITVQNCYIQGNTGYGSIYYSHSSGVDNSGHVIQNCIFATGGPNLATYLSKVGGVLVNNCYFTGGHSIYTDGLTAGQTQTVTNCVFAWCYQAFYAASAGQITEDYNNLYGVQTARTNTSTGAHSKTYIHLPEMRWFFEAVNGGTMITPWDLASYNQLVEVAGSSPTSTDLRGTSVQGSQREWGVLEYDSTLLIESAAGGGGGKPSYGDRSGGKQ